MAIPHLFIGEIKLNKLCDVKKLKEDINKVPFHTGEIHISVSFKLITLVHIRRKCLPF